MLTYCRLYFRLDEDIEGDMGGGGGGVSGKQRMLIKQGRHAGSAKAKAASATSAMRRLRRR